MRTQFFSAKTAMCVAVLLAFGCVAQGSFATGLTLSQVPLFLNEGVIPNLLVTLDDSGSMGRAYTPDSITATANSRMYHSAFYNPMYYNPAVIYQAPKKVTFNAGTGITAYADYPTSYTAAYLNGFRPTLGTPVNLSTDFKASVAYVQGSAGRGTEANNPDDFPSSPINQRAGGVPAYYYSRNNTLVNCTPTNINDSDCYERVFVGATTAERQNFANWYSFYRTRALATASSANLAFVGVSENVRLSWQMLNSCNSIGSGTCSGQSGTAYSNRLRNFANAHRQTFFSWLADTPSAGGTPLLNATNTVGNFLGQTGVDGPNAFAPGTTAAPEYACRGSYHIMMTDGAWNQGALAHGNVDNTSIPALPDGTSYTARAPFRDGSANTLADLAFRYWSRDARTDIANGLKPFTPYLNSNATTQYWDPRNDPATWQHMVSYTIGLGLTRTLTTPNPVWGGSTYQGDYPGLLAGTLNWPAPVNNTDINVYELWHSALNSRGEFFSVESPEAMAAAFKSILGRIASRDSSAAAVSVESAVSRADNEAYYARFSSANWSGELIKYDITSTGALNYAWNARDLLEVKSPSSRNIKFNAGAGLGLRDFLWGNLDASKKAMLNKTAVGVVDALGSSRLDYLRGDQGLEGLTGTQFRPRSFVLGDIICQVVCLL
jgi:type IV pilus assembly protein PilY1